jgi:predicted transcriptional regulator
MLVKDIMTTQVITVTTEDTVEKCANLLMEHKFSGLPVLIQREIWWASLPKVI